MVSTMFYYNVRDIKEQLFTGQQQPFADVLRNKFSQKVRNIRTKTPVLEPLFNKHCCKEIPAQLFSCKYCKNLKTAFLYEQLVKFLSTILCRTTLNGCSQMLKGVARSKQSRNQKLIKEVTVKKLSNNCSGKGFDVL